MTASFEPGRFIEIEEGPTVADGCAGNIEPGSMTFPIIQRLVDGVILVGEDEIWYAITGGGGEEHLMIEGSAAVGVAALNHRQIEGKRVATIVSGRNIL